MIFSNELSHGPGPAGLHGASGSKTMTLYAFLLSIHVIGAILGLGQVVGIAVVASSSRATPSPIGPQTWELLRILVQGTTAGLITMMVTGVLIEWSLGGPYHDFWWFRVSFFELLALGAIHARTRVALRQRDTLEEQATLRGIARRAWVMCLLIAATTVLMETKPF
ncbi:MAG: hypothetical protein QM778_38990 [Myxococcales bacterium]